jgi:hypothetical protein
VLAIRVHAAFQTVAARAAGSAAVDIRLVAIELAVGARVKKGYRHVEI